MFQLTQELFCRPQYRALVKLVHSGTWLGILGVHAMVP